LSASGFTRVPLSVKSPHLPPAAKLLDVAADSSAFADYRRYEADHSGHRKTAADIELHGAFDS
jgi:hypothetical protein